MEAVFKIWKTNRELYSKFLDNYSLNQLNKVPDRFSNNLIWNIGHVIVSQQALVYKLSGLEGYISEELFALYRNGTNPTENTTQNEVDELKQLLTSLIEKTETDFANKKFVAFKAYTTSNGFNLESLEDTLIFNNYHEGMHLGLMMNIRKFV